MLNIFKKTDKIIDICGLRCPEPLMMVRQTIINFIDGQTLYIIADDPATMRDIPNFCRYMNHTLLAQHTEHVPYHYLICKGNKIKI